MVWPGPRPLPRPKLSNYHIGTHFKLFLNSLMKRLQLGGARIGDDGKAAVLLKYYLHVLLKCDDGMCSVTTERGLQNFLCIMQQNVSPYIHLLMLCAYMLCIFAFSLDNAKMQKS